MKLKSQSVEENLQQKYVSLDQNMIENIQEDNLNNTENIDELPVSELQILENENM